MVSGLGHIRAKFGRDWQRHGAAKHSFPIAEPSSQYGKLNWVGSGIDGSLDYEVSAKLPAITMGGWRFCACFWAEHVVCCRASVVGAVHHDKVFRIFPQ